MADEISLARHDVVADGDLDVSISNFSVVTSYNWLDAYTPTILVPGIPPLWSPPSTPIPITRDKGPRYVDENTDRNPGSPHEATVAAISATRADFDFHAVDIITDRRPLRQILRFLNGEYVHPEHGHTTAFELGLELIGNTVLIRRIERTRDPLIQNKKDYRRSFEGNYLKMPTYAAESTSHHRILRYNFGSLKLLVRYAADAYLNPKPTPPDDALDDLVGILKAASLDRRQPSAKNAWLNRVSILKQGQKIPQAATLELSTRSDYSEFDLQDRMPDFWLSQTHHFMLCGYKAAPCSKALFYNLQQTDLAPKITKWEQANKSLLQKLATLLKKVIGIIKTNGGGHWTISFSGEEDAPLLIKRGGGENG
ncbi:uncharacterized protein KY384_005012, partial [Bacidia gigantensis]|uniref:uncharacterized protein n=1 Tax=Bacidia gigantensis TaxID=2732470 RepID=UPI001D03AB0E